MNLAVICALLLLTHTLCQEKKNDKVVCTLVFTHVIWDFLSKVAININFRLHIVSVSYSSTSKFI